MLHFKSRNICVFVLDDWVQFHFSRSQRIFLYFCLWSFFFVFVPWILAISIKRDVFQKYFSNNCKNNSYRSKRWQYSVTSLSKLPFDIDIDFCFTFPSYLTTNALQLLFSGATLILFWNANMQSLVVSLKEVPS